LIFNDDYYEGRNSPYTPDRPRLSKKESIPVNTDSILFCDDETFDLKTKQYLDQKHRSMGRATSSILKLPQDLEILCKAVVPKRCQLTLTEASGSVKASYVIALPEHELNLTLTSHRVTGNLISLIRNPQDKTQSANTIVASMGKCVDRKYKDALQKFVMQVFSHNSQNCVFQIDSSQGEWQIDVHDSANRTHAEIEITSCVLQKPLFSKPHWLDQLALKEKETA
jgi:hypothetical protein